MSQRKCRRDNSNSRTHRSRKTTIINLLSRFYDIDEGNIYIDGIDIKKVTLESLRRQMGVMLQIHLFFSGTIMDNIRYSKLDATDEEVLRPLKLLKHMILL